MINNKKGTIHIERRLEMSESTEESRGQRLIEKLEYKTANAWEKIPDREKVFQFCDEYKGFS